MTREEREKAIDALKISAPVMAVTQEEFNDYIQTLNKIMDWLEQEPCGDAISRQAAIDACLNGWNKDYKEIVEEIRALPPVTPQYTDAEIQKMQDLEFAEIQKAYEIGKAEKPNKWIPVSERLPEEREWYLAVFKEKDTDFQLIPRVADYIGENNWRIIDEDGLVKEYRDILECVAWMPLPEPYKASPTGEERSEE